MAGDSRIQGAGPRLSLDGDLARIMQELRFRGASVRPAVFQAPGPTASQKSVTNECSPDTPYLVTGDRNFRPGTPVLLASFAGTGEEVIIARAAADKAGAASSPVRLSRGSIRRPAPAPSCPPPITGRSYLAIDRGETDISAHLYTDGAYVSTVGSIDIPGGWTLDFFPRWQRVHPSDVVVFKVNYGGGSYGFATWTPATDSLVDLDASGLGGDEPAGPIVVGDSIYFAHIDRTEDELRLYAVDVGSLGVLDAGAAQIGAGLSVTTTMFAPNVMSHSGALTFQVACIDLGVVSIPYHNGAAWNAEAGRLPLAGSEDPGNGGMGVGPGAYSLRETYATPGSAQLGMLARGPGGPEIGLLPEAWAAVNTGDPKLSPNGSELVLFPYLFDGEEEVSPLVRLPVQTTPYGGACTLHRIMVEEGPNARTPEAMLCRN